MLKPLTLSLSLAVALGFCSVSMAGGFDSGCATCGLASSQGGPIASAQGPIIGTSCDGGDACGGGRKKCNLFSGLGGKLDGLHCKLKGILHPPVTYEWVLKKKHLWGHKNSGCDTCGPVESVYPTSQVVPSGQGYAAPSGQGYVAPTGQGYAAPAYGAGQHAYQASKPAPTIASVPAEMSPAFPGEEAPPAPEVKTSGGLLLPTPAGN
ncbi:hypothetical protein [Paludisphaera borealis]|uniref:Uncharacterized protein n=1 Tax=Paludisphaera borealis TaxID=1387353 RepID=A0A1U7CT91_9BACT|nr:hypothetical protein [Paludisphaera borealis]APW62116.1 hypothetical protein BSF38_03648 [Paludisphaera borealis]